MLRALLGIIVLASALYGGYWFIGSQATARGAETWLQERRAEGWQVEYADLKTRGFPNRFDTTLTDIELTDPDTGVSWIAPFFQVLQLSYDPNHLIMIWPKSQKLATPHQKLEITADTMQASLRVKPNTDMELAQANFVAEKAEVISTQDWASGVDDLKLAIRVLPDAVQPNSYQIAGDILGLVPGKKLKELLGNQAGLPETIETLKIDAELAFDEPLKRRTIEAERPDITALKITTARGKWGELELLMAGDMTVDAAGMPSGKLDLTARNWRQMLEMAVQAGAMSSEVAGAAEFGLGLIARASGNQNSLDVPLSFENGRTYLGPIPVGKAPKIKLR